jgi:hypothetical protein
MWIKTGNPFHLLLKLVILRSVTEQAFRAPFAPGSGVNGQSLQGRTEDLLLEYLIGCVLKSKLTYVRSNRVLQILLFSKLFRHPTPLKALLLQIKGKVQFRKDCQKPIEASFWLRTGLQSSSNFLTVPVPIVDFTL